MLNMTNIVSVCRVNMGHTLQEAISIIYNGFFIYTPTPIVSTRVVDSIRSDIQSVMSVFKPLTESQPIHWTYYNQAKIASIIPPNIIDYMNRKDDLISVVTTLKDSAPTDGLIIIINEINIELLIRYKYCILIVMSPYLRNNLLKILPKYYANVFMKLVAKSAIIVVKHPQKTSNESVEHLYSVLHKQLVKQYAIMNWLHQVADRKDDTELYLYQDHQFLYAFMLAYKSNKLSRYNINPIELEFQLDLSYKIETVMMSNVDEHYRCKYRLLDWKSYYQWMSTVVFNVPKYYLETILSSESINNVITDEYHVNLHEQEQSHILSLAKIESADHFIDSTQVVSYTNKLKYAKTLPEVLLLNVDPFVLPILPILPRYKKATLIWSDRTIMQHRLYLILEQPGGVVHDMKLVELIHLHCISYYTKYWSIMANNCRAIFNNNLSELRKNVHDKVVSDWGRNFTAK